MDSRAMGVDEVADLLFSARQRIDFHWNFFVAVVMATIGWVVARDKPLAVTTKLLVSVAYLVASAMNLVGIRSAYALAEALRTDLLRLAAGSPLADTSEVLARLSYPAHGTAAHWVHGLLAVVVLAAVWIPGGPAPQLAAPGSGPRVSNR